MVGRAVDAKEARDVPSSTAMTAEAFRLARLGQLIEASVLLENAARVSADEAGYSDQRCRCGRFVANNELRCFEVLGECAVCFAQIHPSIDP